MSPVKEIYAEKLKIKVYDTRAEMGSEAALEMSNVLKSLLKKKDEVNIAFASAPSQNEFLDAINEIKDIEWERVSAFHIDEYIGLDENASQSFGNYLRNKIFDKIKFKSVNYLQGNANNLEEECVRYANLLEKHKLNIACIGIGENGHVAFNDPYNAPFNDTKSVKIVELDKKSRQQQVNDGCFKNIDEVPKYAITLTIPILISADYIFCIVPGKTKAEAVKMTMKSEINQSFPATILKTHDHAVMYVDKDSAERILHRN